MTMSAPRSSKVGGAESNQPAREKGAEHDHYRSGFSPRVSANGFGGYRHRRVPGKTTSASRRGGEVLPCTGRSEGASGDGSQWTRALVRTTALGVAFRAVDRRCREDPDETRTQAEDGSSGRAVDSAVDAGRSFSEDLGTERGESGSATTAVASASHGAGAHADHESVASGGAQRRTAL